MNKHVEKSIAFVWGAADVVGMFLWMTPVTIGCFFKLIVQQSGKALHKWAWDKDKELTAKQRERLWTTSFVDGWGDMLAEKKARKKAKKQKVEWVNEFSDWYSDDPEFAGYREYDKHNPDRFAVRYDGKLNRI